MPLPCPHGQALTALRRNTKLPDRDKARVAEAEERYKTWKANLAGLNAVGDALLEEMVRLTNEYKRFIEFDLVFCSEDDFLYRQSGQLKINNTILEEFLPHLVDQRLIPGIRHIEGLTVGPQACYGGMFIGPVYAPLDDGGLVFKMKNQDFTVGRKLYLRASTKGDFASVLDTSFNVAYFVSEIKTNLDRTMFQEAAATARDLKTSVGDAVYVLLCEWLDMPPIDTRVTEIDEVIILRKAKRLGSGVRAAFSSSEGRKLHADVFARHLDANPLSPDAFKRLIEKLKLSFPDDRSIDEGTVLARGYF